MGESDGWEDVAAAKAEIIVFSNALRKNNPAVCFQEIENRCFHSGFFIHREIIRFPPSAFVPFQPVPAIYLHQSVHRTLI